MLFTYHVTWCVHVINGLYDFVDNIFLSEATSLSSLPAIDLVEVEIERFSLVVWSPDHVIKELHDFAGGGPSS